MAETAKILAPDKTVLIPDAAAGCSLADSITADELRAWKAEHPGAVVVSYVNTTAAVKAETDVCCTSSNAVEVVASIPADREVLFLPDQFLGAHVRRVTGRENLHVWAGECHVHAGINGATLAAQGRRPPRRRAVRAPRVRLRHLGALPGRGGRGARPSGSGSSRRAACSTPRGARRRVRCWWPPRWGCCTSCAARPPRSTFRAVNDRASCRYMKMITPEKLLRALREGRDEVHVDPELAARGRRGRPAHDRDRHAGRRRVNGWAAEAELVVVGTGVAGLTAAVEAARLGVRVVVVTKDAADAGSTRWAQGGVAVVVGDVPGDSVAAHVADTLTAGGGLCDEAATAAILRDGPRRGGPAAGAWRGLRRRRGPRSPAPGKAGTRRSG